MVPAIGIIVGLYTIVRYFEIVDQNKNWFIRLLAAVFMVATIMIVAGLTLK